MAEFSEVMEQFDRMCWHYRRKYECQTCPMNGRDISQCRNIAFKEPKKTEETVMSWAAEHPEPVYETWLEFVKRFETGGRKSDDDFIYWMGTTSIPADIAQKLGLQPKEGT